MNTTNATEKSRSGANGVEKPWQLPLLMKRLYEDREYNGTEIAERLGCSTSTVYRWLEKHGIDRRSRAHAHAPVYTNPQGYETWDTYEPDGERARVLVHRLLAIAECGFEAVAESHVHHKNHIPWDNRPENIDVLSPEAHRNIHADERRISQEQVIKDIRCFATIWSGAPRRTIFSSFAPYSDNIIGSRFGSWEKALDAAGVDPGTGDVLTDEWSFESGDVENPFLEPDLDSVDKEKSSEDESDGRDVDVEERDGIDELTVEACPNCGATFPTERSLRGHKSHCIGEPDQ